MRVLIVRIQIVNTLGINEDYILVVIFLCGCWKTLVRFSCTETGKPALSMNQMIHTDSLIRWPWPSLLFPSPTFKTPVWRSAQDSCQYQAYSTARLLTEQCKVLPSFPMLHTPVQKQKLVANHKFALYLYQNQVWKYSWQRLQYFCIKSNSDLCYVYSALTQLTFRPGTYKA